jgi:DNA-binding LacI/PurR family transcriptional regulator
VFFREAAAADGRVPTSVVDGAGGPGVQVVGADVEGAAAAMASRLYDLGHRDLAVLAWPGAGERLTGVRKGWGGSGPLTVFSVEPQPAQGATGETAERRAPPPAAGEALARAALARRPRPTALLALSDTLALSALHAAHWMGLAVLADVSVVGLDDLPGSSAGGSPAPSSRTVRSASAPETS